MPANDSTANVHTVDALASAWERFDKTAVPRAYGLTISLVAFLFIAPGRLFLLLLLILVAEILILHSAERMSRTFVTFAIIYLFTLLAALLTTIVVVVVMVVPYSPNIFAHQSSYNEYDWILGPAAIVVIMGFLLTFALYLLTAIFAAVKPMITASDSNRFPRSIKNSQASSQNRRTENIAIAREPFVSPRHPVPGTFVIGAVCLFPALLSIVLAHLLLAYRIVPPDHFKLALFGLALPIVALGLLALQRPLKHVFGVGTRLMLSDAKAVFESSTRKPILYMRPFKDDDLEMFKQTRLAPRESFEEVLSKECDRRGPLVAIGAPEETLPKLGASRSYFSSQTWQDELIEWMGRAQMLVVSIGISPWVKWEVVQILEKGYLRKAMFVVPPVGALDARHRCEFLFEALGKSRTYAELGRAVSERILVVYFDRYGALNVIQSSICSRYSYGMALRLAFSEINIS